MAWGQNPLDTLCIFNPEVSRCKALRKMAPMTKSLSSPDKGEGGGKQSGISGVGFCLAFGTQRCMRPSDRVPLGAGARPDRCQCNCPWQRNPASTLQGLALLPEGGEGVGGNLKPSSLLNRHSVWGFSLWLCISFFLWLCNFWRNQGGDRQPFQRLAYAVQVVVIIVVLLPSTLVPQRWRLVQSNSIQPIPCHLNWGSKFSPNF